MPVNKEKLSPDEQRFLVDIGLRVKYLRLKKDLSQSQLAELSGLSDSTISHLESSNVYSVSTISLFRIATALNVSPESIFHFD